MSKSQEQQTMPVIVYFLALAVFALTTSEFMVAGMMPSLAQALNVSVPEVGYLISYYAAGMVIGGPVLMLALLNVPRKRALLVLIGVYTIGQSVAAAATTYEIMVVGRILCGVAASACFGLALAICAQMVAPGKVARSAAIVISGLMFATVFGVPAATALEQALGWRFVFWLVAAMTAASGVLLAVTLPASRIEQRTSAQAELVSLNNGRLWAAYGTSALIIGATFAAFSYFSPILLNVSGYDASTIPLLLMLYGAATVIGNFIVGRLADRHTMQVLFWGQIVLTAALIAFALFGQLQPVALGALILIGLTGVALNPAMVARVIKTANASPLVNTVHASVINIGLFAGSALGGLGISLDFGMRAPLWVGAGLAVLGVLSVVPLVFKERASTEAAEVPATLQSKCA